MFLRAAERGAFIDTSGSSIDGALITYVITGLGLAIGAILL